MGTAAAPQAEATTEAPKGPRNVILTLTAPSGSHFEMEEVHTAKGAESLGQVPILVWDDLDAAISHYGAEGVKDVLDGTSLRVSFQNIARRFCIASKSNDEIAKAQVDFKPGKRQGGVSTPKSRASRAAASAAEKVSNPDLITNLLQQIAEGKLSEADLAALAGQ